METLRVTYARAADLRRDLDGQLAHGGLLVLTGDTDGLELHRPAALEIVAPDGTTTRGEGTVLHVQAGHGVAVSFPPDRVAKVRALAATLPADAEGAGPARHERVSAASPQAPAATPPQAPAATSSQAPVVEEAPDAAPEAGKKPFEAPTSADKIQLALHGNKDERTAILRDRNRMLHAYVLRNPQITADEVLAVAKNPLSTPELLGQIAERKEWYQKSSIALALVRNPKTPGGAGLRALEYIPNADLRQIAKGTSAPPHIVTAARKKVLG